MIPFPLATVQQRWDRFWFAPDSAVNLAVARILVSAQALWVLLSRDYAGLSGLPAPFWAGTRISARLRYLVFPGHETLESTLQVVAIGALIAVLLGFYARPASLIAGALLYHLAPLEALFWTPAPYVRGQTLVTLCLIVLGASRCDDALAIRPTPAAGGQAVSGGAYGWPLRLIQLFLAEVYLFSALTKLTASGWGWASPTNIRNWLLRATDDPEWTVFHQLGEWLASHPAVCLGIGVGTLLFELGFGLALFRKSTRVWLVPAALLFHLGILFSMNLTFLSAPLLLVFVDWEKVGSGRSLDRPVAPERT